MEEAERIAREEHGSTKIFVISGMWEDAGYGCFTHQEEEEEGGLLTLGCLFVLTGVGTRHYYRKLGYELDGPYMAKSLIWNQMKNSHQQNSDTQ